MDMASWVRTKIEGWPMHSGDNQRVPSTAVNSSEASSLLTTPHSQHQQWEFINTGDGWAIQSCHRGEDGRPLYLSVKGHLGENGEVVHSTVPMSWYIRLVDGALRYARLYL